MHIAAASPIGVTALIRLQQASAIMSERIERDGSHTIAIAVPPFDGSPQRGLEGACLTEDRLAHSARSAGATAGSFSSPGRCAPIPRETRKPRPMAVLPFVAALRVRADRPRSHRQPSRPR